MVKVEVEVGIGVDTGTNKVEERKLLGFTKAGK